MSDYQGRLKVTLQGLDQLRQLDDRLGSIEERAESVRQAIAGIGDALKTNLNRRNTAFRDLVDTREERLSAQGSIRSTAQRRNAQRGTFLQGPNVNARRLARQRLEAANIDSQNAQLELGQALQERRDIIRRGRRLQQRTLPSLVLGGDRVAGKREKTLRGVTESASLTNQQLRLGGFEAQYERRLQAFRRGGGGTNAPGLIEKVFAITQAYNVQKRVISATGDTSAKVTRRQATELNALSSTLGKYNEAQLEANRLARSRVERLSAARKLGDRLRPLEAASGTARDPKTGELFYPNVTRPAFPRREVGRARLLVNRAAAAAESGDQELFRLASFQAKKIIDRMEAGAKAGLRNAPSSPIRGSARTEGSPAYMERMARIGGARESVKGRKDLPGSPAYIEEQQRQLAKAIRAGGPSEKISGRKDLPGSPAYIEDQQRKADQIARLQKRDDERALQAQRRERQKAIRAGGPREKIGGRKDLPGSPAYIADQQKKADQIARLQARDNERALRVQRTEQNRIARLQQIASPIGGTATMVGSPAYLAAQEKARLANPPTRRLGPASPIGGTKAMVGSPAYLAEQQRQQSNQKGFLQGDLRSAIGDALIGGAFPALFGQGLGASAGGLAGGLAGGAVGGNFGFGLSLVGTALGQVVDTTIGKLGSLGDALGSASDSIKGLEDAGFRVRDSQKVQITQLEKVGRGYDAQAVALKEVESRLGPGSVAQIEKLNEAQKQLSDSWAALSLQLGVSLIPVVAGAASLIADLFGKSPGGSGSGAAPKSTRPRKPSEVLADIDASIALSQALKAGNREYASLVRDAEDWRRDNEDKIFQMRRQGVDIEKQKSDLRLDVENKIFDMRQQAATLEADNTRARAQLAINSFGLGLDRRADAIGGRAGDFITQVREYLQARDQGESELQAKEKTAKLQIAANERNLQQYILQVSDKVASIARTVEDYKRDQEKFRFESSRRIEDYRIKAEDYIYSRVKDRYEYAIGSEQEILRIKMEAAAALGVALPADAGRVLSGTGPTAVGMAGLANPLGAQSSGLKPNWNQGLGAGRGHQGQDIGVDVGTTIHAIEDAVVEGVIRGFGKAGDAVILRYANSDKLGVYGHINPAVGAGQRVTAGQQIGTITRDVRRDGSNNSHLHYELWKRRRGAGGELLDPTERLRAAMSGRRARPPMPATSSQRRSGPAMLLPGVTGPALQPSAPATTDSMFDRRQSSARPGIGDQFISLLSKQGGFEDPAGSAVAQKRLQTYAPAPLAPPTLPASPQLPAVPAPMAMPDIRPLATELRKQNSELLQSVQLADKLEQVENGRLLLQLSSTREVRDRLEDATKELALESKIAELGKSLSDNDQSRAVEKTRTAFAAEELNRLERQSLGFANELLQKGKLQKEEYDSITRGLRERIGYEKDLLQVAEDRAEVARQEAFNQRSGEIVRETRLAGAGLRAGRIGAEARAFEEELRLSGDVGKANQMADNTKRLEDQRLVWANLEKDIISVSDAISGALTNGLVDIASGARSIQDVGRDMLSKMAGSFADSAQQQLGNLMQRQLSGLLGGQQGPLVKMLGAGAEAAGPQALGAASMVASGQVAAFGMALQTVAAQMAFSSALGGGSALSGALGSAVSGGATNLFSKGISDAIPGVAFGGFLANGGTAQAGKGYVVGEKEPEFFFPGVTGRVVPRSDMEKAAALGQSGGQADPLELDYTVTERQGERMVTEEQMRRNNALLLKQAQARTLASMRNNKEVRDFVNI